MTSARRANLGRSARPSHLIQTKVGPSRLQVCSDLRGGAHPQEAMRHLGPDLVQALTAVPTGSGAGASRTPASSGRAAATPELSGSVANKTKTELYSMYVEAQRAQRQSAAEQKKAEDSFSQVSYIITEHLRCVMQLSTWHLCMLQGAFELRITQLLQLDTGLYLKPLALASCCCQSMGRAHTALQPGTMSWSCASFRY